VRGLLAVVLVLGALLVGADRLGEQLAEGAVAKEVARSQGLPQRPDVEVTGFPFLTQALRGRYDAVDVRVEQLTAGGAAVQDLVAHLHGVQVPLRSAIAGSVAQVPVEAVDATGRVSYAAIASAAGDRRLTVTPAGDLVKVTGEVDVVGRTLRASAFSTVRLDGQTLVVSAQRFDVGSGKADDLLRTALKDRFDLRVKIGALPYGLQLTGLTLAPDGVRLTATGGPTVLRAG
jgi:LmeA-like phospholipid-binding